MEDGMGYEVIDNEKVYSRLNSNPKDELRQFRRSLLFLGLGLDQSSLVNAICSWILFCVMAIGMPLLIYLAIPYDSSLHARPYNTLVQISQSVVAYIAFFCLSRFVRKYGIRRFLFLDQLCDESNRVRLGYTKALNSAYRLLSWFLLPCFLVELGDKVWWYTQATVNVPLIRQRYLANAVVCTAEIVSWLYRTAVFFLVCVLFRLTCHLQILRLEDFIKGFRIDQGSSPLQIESVLKDHQRIKHQLRVISHRFRVFIITELITITFSQFVTLFITTEANSQINLFKAGDLALCSVVLVTGLVILLQSATTITHKAQSINSVVTRWHAWATCSDNDSGFSPSSTNAPLEIYSTSPMIGRQNEFPGFTPFDSDPDSDYESCDPTRDEEKRKSISIFCQSQIASFQKRQAIVKYFEHNHAGITVFGFVFDRTSLHMIFCIEFSLVLFILGKTISTSTA